MNVNNSKRRTTQ